MTRRTFTGLIAAAHTPFHPDGTLHLDAIAAQAERYRRFGVSAAFICGTTGEGKLMTLPERQRVAETWMTVSQQQTPVIAHVGCEAIPDSQQLAAHAEAIGVDAISVVAPSFYLPASIDALVQWCAAIAEAAPNTPFYYYHIPSMTGVHFSMSEFVPRAVERISTFAGLKFTDTDLMEFSQCLRWANGQYDILFGRDEMLLAALALGARGAVGSTYNYAAPLFLAMWEAFNRGDLNSANRVQLRLQDMVAVLREFGEFAVGKAIMGRLGVDCGPVRPPLQGLSVEQTDRIVSQLETLGFIEAFEQTVAC